ncbi:MAG TPA: DNA internalization-related competence protein ComEC/Rec2 [Bryobacteraceae bacterium]|nr:DNA internalization-related competence protein ComEC/Rec2 [Bryobacteraceae bacterium]
MRDRLVTMLAALAAGIALANWTPFHTSDFYWAFPLLACLSLVALRLRPRMLPICTSVILGFTGAFLEMLHRPGNPPQIDAGARETVIIDGCVVSPPAFSEGRDQFVIEIAPKARARVSLTLRDGETPPGLRYGQRVELQARVRPIRNFHNPGEFDYQAFSARSFIYWTAVATGAGSVRVEPGGCGSRWTAAIFAIRTGALARIDRLYRGNAYATAMMEATLIGESSRMERIWTEHFRRTGTYHLLVIDGLHITVLAAFLLFLMRLCFLPELSALVITASTAWLYALVSGWNAPAIRAAGGFTLYVIARYFYRRARLMNLLAAVAIVYLLFDPGQLFEAGFQLSFLAVAAIGLLAVPILERTSALYTRGVADITQPRRAPRLPPRAAQFRLELHLAAETASYYIRLPRQWWERFFAILTRIGLYAFELALLSAVMQIGLALPMAIYFHRISLTGISANILVVPLLGLVIPLGFLAVLTMWHAAAALAGWLLDAGEHIAEWHTHLEPVWRVLAPPLWLAVAFTAGLVMLALALPRSPRWSWAALAAVLGLFALIFWHPFPAEVRQGQLELTAIDVGQGDSLLVSFPDSKLMLIDAGGALSFGRRPATRLDIGEDVVSPYLWSRSIRKIDVVVLTHAHDDHAGGMPAVIENFHPSELWTGATAPSATFSLSWSAIQKEARAEHVKIAQLSSGRSFEFGGARVEVVSPPPDYVPAAGPMNNDSLALRITYGRRSLLLTGDMEKPMERRALADAEPLRADILKVGHHGSNTSSIDPFLDAVAPEFAVISDGFANSFGHPNAKVLERLHAHGSRVLRTDSDGLVTLRTDGRRIWVETFRGQSWPQSLRLLPASSLSDF